MYVRMACIVCNDLSWPGDSWLQGPSDGIPEPEFSAAGEQLEEDEELKSHIYGCNTFFSKPVPETYFSRHWNNYFPSMASFKHWSVRYVESAFAEHVSNLPTRYLPPGTVKMIFYEFRLAHKNVSTLSFELQQS